MITITVSPGEAVRIEFEDTDGAFVICYGKSELTVTSDLPGSHVGGEGVIYREVFMGCTCEHNTGSGHRMRDLKCPEHGNFSAKALAGCTCESSFADGAYDPKCPEHAENSPKRLRMLAQIGAKLAIIDRLMNIRGTDSLSRAAHSG